MKLLHFLFPILALLDVAPAPAQTRQPAQITTLPTTTPQEFDLLDKTGKWLPLNTGAGVDVRMAGCVADGVTDQTACINNALANASDCVIIPATQLGFYVAGTLTVTHCLRGTVFNPSDTATANLSGTSRILCNNQAVQPCVVVNQLNSATAAQIANISLVGTSGGAVSATPVAGSWGFQWQQGGNLVVTNFQSSNFDSCAYIGPIAPAGSGPISIKATNTFFTRCRKHYLVDDGVPELYLIGGRWGSNNDYTTPDDFIYATKTTSSGSGGGPNTIVLDSMQLNTPYVGCPFRWGGFTGTGGGWGANKVSNSHVELLDAGYTGSATQGIICVDNTLSYVPGMQFTNNTIQTDGGASLHPGFNIAPSVPVKDNLIFVGNRLTGAPFTLTISGLVGSFTPTFIGNYLQSSNTFVAGDTTAQLSMIGNYYGGVTFNGKWNNLNLAGNIGTFNDNATGNVYQTGGYNLANPWTPTLSLTGGSVTYATQSGNWVRTQNGGLSAYFFIALSGVSSPTGSLSLTGLPKTCVHPSANVLQTASGLTGLVGAPYAAWVNGGASINLMQNTTTGQVNLTGANLTATTNLIGTVTCGVAQ